MTQTLASAVRCVLQPKVLPVQCMGMRNSMVRHLLLPVHCWALLLEYIRQADAGNKQMKLLRMFLPAL